MDGLSLTVVRSIKDVAKTLAAPCFGIAYFLQSGGAILHFSWWWPWQSPPIYPPLSVALPVFFNIFALKVIIGSLVFIVLVAFAQWLARQFQPRSDTWPSLIIPTMGLSLRAVLFGFTLLGLFFRPYYPEIRSLNAFWYVASLVWGLSFIPRSVATLSDPVPKLPPRL